MRDQIVGLVQQYVAGEISASDFSQSFAGFYFAVRQNRNAEPSASRLCGDIVGPLAEFSRGHRSVDSLREELANAIRPFVESIQRKPPASIRLSDNEEEFDSYLYWEWIGKSEVATTSFERLQLYA
jgi:hypothetical protein